MQITPQTAREIANDFYEINHQNSPQDWKFVAYENNLEVVYVQQPEEELQLLADFVGGVTYALAAQGVIRPETALPANVTAVCKEIERRLGAHAIDVRERWDKHLQYGPRGDG